MSLFRSVWRSRLLIINMGRRDFKNRFSSTDLGSVWGFVQPMVFMFMYVFVFQFILKMGSAGSSPFIVWFLPGLAMWLFLNDGVLGVSSSIRSYSYLVKKVMFPIEIIPFISLFSCTIMASIVASISTLICLLYGYVPNILAFVYYWFSAVCLIVAITRLTVPLSTILPDVSKMLEILMQIMFWVTPIVWNSDSRTSTITAIIDFNPFAYLVKGIRQSFIGGSIWMDHSFLYTIVFWAITISLFAYGDLIFKRVRKSFADVL